MTLEEKIKLHNKILNDIHDTYIKKQNDYGDSFGKSFAKRGITSAIVRMEDKWNRLDNLTLDSKRNMVEDESIEDTLLDLANYAIMTNMELRIRREENNGKKEKTTEPRVPIAHIYS